MQGKAWSDVEFLTYISQVAGGTRGMVQSQQCPGDQYWIISILDGLTTNGTGQDLAWFLLEPTSPLANQQSVPASFEPNFELSCYTTMIRAVSGGNNGNPNSIGDQVSNENSTRGLSSPMRIIVPPLWYVALIETNGVIAGGDHNLAMRMQFLRLAVGCPIPVL